MPVTKPRPCNYACFADPDTCFPSATKKTEQTQDGLEADDELSDAQFEQEEHERDEFAKKWDDINYLVQKPFCCK